MPERVVTQYPTRPMGRGSFDNNGHPSESGIGRQRTGGTGAARLGVRRSSMGRLGFGQTHGLHSTFEKL